MPMIIAFSCSCSHPRHGPSRTLCYHQRGQPLPRQIVRSTVRRLPLLSLSLAGLLLAGWAACAFAQSQLYEVKASRDDPNYRRRPRTDPQTDPNRTPPGGIDTRITVEISTGDETAG